MTRHFLRSTCAGLVLGAAGLAQAHEPAPLPAERWKPATLRAALAQLPPGDSARGERVHHQLFCDSCHGERGVAPTHNWPHVAGQKAAYTAKMMLDYQSGLRREGPRAELMHDLAVMMTPQQIADVAAYYASLPLPGNDGTPRPAKSGGGLPAEHLMRKGDPSRLLTPCASCHGVKGQGGKLEAAALAGQNPRYFVRTMLDYHGGVRQNDAVKGMSAFARKLTRGEVDALAAYYADLPR